MFQLDLKSRVSIYQQIVDQVKELIVAGILNPGDKLPSVRDLARTLTVNPNTIQKAFRDLEYQGYVTTSPGLGTYVAKPDFLEPDPRKLESLKAQLERNMKELLYLGLSLDQADAIWNELLQERSTVHDQD